MYYCSGIVLFDGNAIDIVSKSRRDKRQVGIDKMFVHIQTQITAGRQ